jgi:hypothetical protein
MRLAAARAAREETLAKHYAETRTDFVADATISGIPVRIVGDHPKNRDMVIVEAADGRQNAVWRKHVVRLAA